MDIVLLPCNESTGLRAIEKTFGRLFSLYQWLREYDAIPDVYISLPARQADHQAIIDSLPVFPSDEAGFFYIMIPAGMLRPELLVSIAQKKGYRVIILQTNGAEVQQTIDVLTSYRNLHAQQAPEITCWLEQEGRTSNYRSYNLLQKAGATRTELPLFGRAKEIVSVLHHEITDMVWQHQPLCAIAGETIVINTKGDVLFCPSTNGHEKTGNLFDQSFEQLLLKKGRCLYKAGRMNNCMHCNYRGRFQWMKNKNEKLDALLRAGSVLKENSFLYAYDPWDNEQYDIAVLTEEEQAIELAMFEQRLHHWASQENSVVSSLSAKPQIAIETPVFKGGWLIPCIESVLFQTTNQWTYYMVWDGGDELSRKILEIIKKLGHPRLQVFFSENRGIARARYFLSSRSAEEYILPLDDDDMLGSTAVEEFITAAAARPWSSIIRGRRKFIDEKGKVVEMEEWFPFENRKYRHGMVTDLHNHCQPALMRRSAYAQTEGWKGFADFLYAGEDCDIYLKLEEKGSIELVDKVLYFYRLNPQRTSHELKPEGAYEMWRRLADRTISRIGLPVKRLNEQPPFDYVRQPLPQLTQDMIDFVIPFYEADEKELQYDQGRPSSTAKPEYFELNGHNSFVQEAVHGLLPVTRVELLFSAEEYAEGIIQLEITGSFSHSVIAVGQAAWKGKQQVAKAISFTMQLSEKHINEQCFLKLRFIPSRKNYATVKVLYYDSDEPKLIARFFRHEKDYSKKVLDRCLRSLQKAGIEEDAIHIVNARRSSAANRNSGFGLTSRPLVCFLDDDVEILSGNTFRDLLQEMEVTGADLIGPRLVTPAGRIFCADPFFNKGLRPVPKGIGEQDDGTYHYTSEVPWLPSTLFIVKREVLMAVNGFDEGYAGSQMEDVDFCLKARQRDFKCVYAGNIAVVHYNNQRNDRFAENFERFLLRWKHQPGLFNPV